MISESTFSYFEALESYLLEHGRPVAFYSDKHTVFRFPEPNESMTGMTQFGRALVELNIEIICANSSQVKGRIERVNRTLQDWRGLRFGPKATAPLRDWILQLGQMDGVGQVIA